jgi:hypothetical protein
VNGRPNRDLEEHPAGRAVHQADSREFWQNIGVDVEGMSPKAQVATSLALLVPVVGGYLTLIAFFPYLWWLIFVFGWTVFPAFGLLLRGVAGLSEGGSRASSASEGERELLRALREHGELTPAQAAMETSLTVEEADRMLRELATGGHLDVRVRGGGLFYALWEHGEEASRRP